MLLKEEQLERLKFNLGFCINTIYSAYQTVSDNLSNVHKYLYAYSILNNAINNEENLINFAELKEKGIALPSLNKETSKGRRANQMAYMLWGACHQNKKCIEGVLGGASADLLESTTNIELISQEARKLAQVYLNDHAVTKAYLTIKAQLRSKAAAERLKSEEKSPEAVERI